MICARWWMGILAVLSFSIAGADEAVLTVLHSNDVYGQLTRRDGQGGMAARVQVMRDLSQTGAVVVLDAGDALSPDPLSRFDGGATMVAAMRRAGVRAMAVGNHELSLGWEVLAARQAEAGFPFLAANLSRRDGGASPLPGHVLLQAGDLKVGVLGVLAALQDTSVALVIDDFSGRDHRGVWRANWGVEGAFNRNYIDGTTRAYRAERERVSFLSGETSVAWNASMVGVLAHARSRHLYLFENRVAFGQVGTTFGDLDKSQDQVDADVTYSYRAPNWLANPFVSAGYSTAMTRTDAQRPALARGSTGFQKRFGGTLSARLGGRAQRDFSADQSDLGVELGLDLRRSLGARGRLHSRMRSFFGLTDRRVVSLENYNTLNFPLAGSLSLAIRQNNFVYRVNKIRDVPMDGVAVRWDLTLGLVYDVGWKWY